MRFSSHQIKGKGRGKLLGFPTINLKIPEKLALKEGIYSVRVFILGQEFIGAMHYGPIPAFKELQKTLEVFIIDISPDSLPETKGVEIEIETNSYLRPVQNFLNEKMLTEQISKDVLETKKSFGTGN